MRAPEGLRGSGTAEYSPRHRCNKSENGVALVVFLCYYNK
jgi:hypothetical protein